MPPVRFMSALKKSPVYLSRSNPCLLNTVLENLLAMNSNEPACIQSDFRGRQPAHWSCCSANNRLIQYRICICHGFSVQFHWVYCTFLCWIGKTDEHGWESRAVQGRPEWHWANCLASHHQWWSVLYYRNPDQKDYDLLFKQLDKHGIIFKSSYVILL